MATTYTLISSVTVGSGGAANIEFTSIPGTYTDLVLKLSGRTTYTGLSYRFGELQFNGSSANLSNKVLYGDGTSAISGNDTTIYFYNDTTTATASTFDNIEFYIPNYAGSTFKSVSLDGVTENNGTTAIAYLLAGLWSNTAAITSIKLDPNSGDFVQYTTAYLYGISNA